MIHVQNVNSDSLEILMLSTVMVAVVGSLVFTLVGGLTFLVFRDK